MIKTVKSRLLTNWHLTRWIALAVGSFFIIQALQYQDMILGLVGGFFLFQAVTNTGCLCGSCAVTSSPSAEPNDSNIKQVEFTQINGIDMPRTKQTETFNDIINADKPVLVDFYADWCGPCKMMGPILKKLKKKMGDQINIIKIDAEKNVDAAIKYNISGVPTLILFKDGEILWQKSGVMQAHQLESTINQNLGIS
ncbi:thioredoxin [Fodinibius salinus]|uniref:Thioredoxin n=1 Tax=Fodinibius salinus TaxID=860790 RepID=A0A5D3YQE8_9BACT|nr:thioredoxin [Fodinibius salinus]TYP94781.1 thioredoxin [Fodinibius salinus]